ncbi:hypothetical protein Syun_006916 [Stephania yunnanensis]|uniref:Uncharacterized protein n=1 Tax=Stephania yunnanensis TaxID=152371 RepID=A0AAP0L042_9MAGN
MPQVFFSSLASLGVLLRRFARGISFSVTAEVRFYLLFSFRAWIQFVCDDVLCFPMLSIVVDLKRNPFSVSDPISADVFRDGTHSSLKEKPKATCYCGGVGPISGRERGGPNKRRGRLRRRPGGGRRLGEVRAATVRIRPAAAARCPMNGGAVARNGGAVDVRWHWLCTAAAVSHAWCRSMHGGASRAAGALGPSAAGARSRRAARPNPRNGSGAQRRRRKGPTRSCWCARRRPATVRRWVASGNHRRCSDRRRSGGSRAGRRRRRTGGCGSGLERCDGATTTHRLIDDGAGGDDDGDGGGGGSPVTVQRANRRCGE